MSVHPTMMENVEAQLPQRQYARFRWALQENSRSHLQFLCGCEAADAHIGSFIVVGPSPLRGEFLCLLGAFDNVLVEPFMSVGAVAALDMGILMRPAGLDMAQGDALVLNSVHQLAADTFRSVFHT